MFDYNPVPKPEKQEKKKKTGLNKMKPYGKKLPFKKKKKKPKTKREEKAKRDGLKPPSTKTRNDWSDYDYAKAIEMFGTVCNDPTCALPACELHHIIYRSQSGRGVWRNALPLCISHHDKVHNHKRYREMWVESRRRIYGEYFYMDMWDLWLKGLIADPVKHFYEDFMRNQEVKMRYEKEIHNHKK